MPLNSRILLFLHSSLAVWTETGTGTVLFRIASWDCLRKGILEIFVIANKRNTSLLRADQKWYEKRAATGERQGGATTQSCRAVLQPRFVFFSIGVALMSCKVNFHLVRSALQISICLLRIKLKFEGGNLTVHHALQALQLFLRLDLASKWLIAHVRYIKF